MRVGERDETIQKLQEELRKSEARFDAEARKRGFDPAQAENMALPKALAELSSECEEIRTRLAAIVDAGSQTKGEE